MAATTLGIYPEYSLPAHVCANRFRSRGAVNCRLHGRDADPCGSAHGDMGIPFAEQFQQSHQTNASNITPYYADSIELPAIGEIIPLASAKVIACIYSGSGC